MPSGSSVPSGAVVGGHDIDYSTIYVGRTYHESDELPCKVVPSRSGKLFEIGCQIFQDF